MFTLHFKTKDNTDKKVIANRIHEALQGNYAYINNDIVLNMDGDCLIELYIGKANSQGFDMLIDCTDWNMTTIYKEYFKKHFGVKEE